MIVDFHVHMEPWPFNGKDASVKAVLANLDEAGADMAVVFPLARWDTERTRQANDYVAEQCSKWSKKLVPFCSVNPADGEAAVEELERCALELKVRGLKLHPSAQGFDPLDDTVLQLVQRVGELGLIVLIDSYNPFDGSIVGRLLRLALACPETIIVLAHAFGTQMDELLALHLLERHGVGSNVYCDLSATLNLYEGSPRAAHLAWLVNKVGPHRFLLGSDYPEWRSREALRALSALGLGPSETAVAGTNALGLLKDSPPPGQ